MTRYEKYKPSGVEWIGAIPEHWNVKRLKFLALVQPSNVDKKTVEDEESVLLCNYMHVYKNEFIDDSINFMEATASENEINKFKIKYGDVLVTKDSETPNDIAKPAFVRNDFKNVICGYHLTQIRPNRDELIGEYLFRLFQQHRYKGQFEVNANGVTRFGLSVASFSDAFVPLPLKDEQSAIAVYLDDKTTQIDKLIANKQKLIELLKEERTAIINQAVTKGIDPSAKLKPSGIEWLGDIPEHWEVCKLKHLIKVKDGTHDTPDYIPQADGSFPLITSKDIKSGRIDFSDAKHISKDDYDKINDRSNVTFGDVIMPMIGTVGGSVIVNTWEKFSIKNVALFKTSVSSINGQYISHVINSKFIVSQFDLSSRGGVQEFVSLDILRNLLVFKLDSQEQTDIVCYIENVTNIIDSTISKIGKEIDLLKEYRMALISEVVTGKVKVV